MTRQWKLEREYEKDPDDGDGQFAAVYSQEWPAKFSAVIVSPGKDSVGEARPGFTLSTGSGDEMNGLCHAIAKAASLGMIGLDKVTWGEVLP